MRYSVSVKEPINLKIKKNLIDIVVNSKINVAVITKGKHGVERKIFETIIYI